MFFLEVSAGINVGWRLRGLLSASKKKIHSGTKILKTHKKRRKTPRIVVDRSIIIQINPVHAYSAWYFNIRVDLNERFRSKLKI